MVQVVVPDAAESNGAKPQFLGTTVSTLCSVLPRPLIITGLFRELLTRHFAAAEYIETPELVKLLWQKGEQTRILIESIHRWRPQLTEKRPAVIIKRNGFANRRVGIADLNQGPSTDRRGARHYNTYWVGSHTLFCIAGSGAAVDLLGAEVLREMHHFHPVIRDTALLHRFQVMEVGPVAELEEATENFVVPITVGYQYEDQWVLQQERPILRSVRLSFITDC